MGHELSHELSHGTSIRKLWPGDIQGPAGMHTASWTRIHIEAALALTTAAEEPHVALTSSRVPHERPWSPVTKTGKTLICTPRLLAAPASGVSAAAVVVFHRAITPAKVGLPNSTAATSSYRP